MKREVIEVIEREKRYYFTQEDKWCGNVCYWFHDDQLTIDEMRRIVEDAGFTLRNDWEYVQEFDGDVTTGRTYTCGENVAIVCTFGSTVSVDLYDTNYNGNL